MNSNQWVRGCMIGAAALATLGCRTVIREQPVVVADTRTTTQPIIIQSETMPPPRVEQPGPAPTPQDVWVAGHWEKTSAGWSWKAGHWETRR